eukprot:TRINITY_DN24173_c0_g1_i1.p1 TRINITY_DN24173_c0_g1~~TRINITY_DN24173_c0_g1_i1.p1  ORF type:complete len:725 (+),score=199.81 TRINITY_DN24173_c0_g1_i1:38-2212(+)
MKFFLALLAAASSASGLCSTWDSDPVSCVRAYNVVWDNLLPESSSTWVNTMPIGNGVVAANVWSDGIDTVSLLISSTEAWNEASQIIKVGIVDVKFSPPPTDKTFKQTLDVGTGTISITMGSLTATVWVDANSNTFVVDHASTDSTAYTAASTITLARPTEVKGFKGQFECENYDISADVMVTTPKGHAFYHRNVANFNGQNYFKNMVFEQNLGNATYSSIPNRLENRTTGGLVSTDGTKTLVTVLTAQTAAVGDWTAQIQSLVQTPSKASHDAWWASFWARSHLETSDSTVSRQYFLQRYLQACQARSPFPVKFNGMLFTSLKPPQVDYRQWGGRNWWQNARLPYYNMLPAGDVDMLQTLLDSFLATLPQAKATTQHYYNITGAFWNEYTDSLFGTTHAQSYGCNRGGVSSPPYWWMSDRWNHYNFQGSLDLSLLALDYYSHTGDDKYLTIADEVLDFYRQFRTARDANGKMVLYPTQSLETWQCPNYPPDPKNCATNDLPTIAGMMTVSEKLLQTSYGSAQQKANWKALQAIIPPLPISGGKLQPCAVCPPSTSNVENTELYAVHPYRRYTAGRNVSDLEVAIEAFKTKRFTSDNGWNQNIMDAALLGLASQAQDYAVKRAAVGPANGYRFPAFMPHEQDFPPSADHLAVYNNALGYMVLQEDETPEHNLKILPAWPCSWDLAFKLHGPLNTTVTGTVVSKKITYTVTPASRAGNVHVVPCQ